MKVWVIMGNDYPEAVLSSQESADAFLAEKKTYEENRRNQGHSHGRIYWRAYDFELLK